MELSIELRIAPACRAMNILMSCDYLASSLLLLVGTQRSHRNEPSARVLNRNNHDISRTLHTTLYTSNIMPKRQRRLSSNGTEAEAEADTSSEATASPPPTSPAFNTNPDRGHDNRLLHSVRRQPVEHVGPPISDLLRMLAANREMQQLERVRRVYASSDPSLPADNASEPDYAWETRAAALQRLYEAIRRSEQRWHDERRELRERRERRAHAEVANLLTYDSAGTMVYIDNTQIVVLTL
jgi:hypothetical protein